VTLVKSPTGTELSVMEILQNYTSSSHLDHSPTWTPPTASNTASHLQPSRHVLQGGPVACLAGGTGLPWTQEGILGDFLRARMSAPARNAGASGKVTDFNNGINLSASLCSGRARSHCLSYSSTPVKGCLLSEGQGTKAITGWSSQASFPVVPPRSTVIVAWL
jgi:hypothetical protein